MKLQHHFARELRAALMCIAWLLVVGAALPVRAEMRALLVGASGYAQRPLEGPRNDVRRMREVLEQRGFAPAQITTLADGVPGAAGEPTREGILSALDRLAATAKAGDFVFLYFAGHGSQQPADRNTPHGRAEADGMHETFLPLDVGRWDGQAGTVRNAIVDFELRDKVERILARSAFVWAVFDACHSTSLVRGVPDPGTRWRHVDPLDLGVPQALLDSANATALSRPTGVRGATNGATYGAANVPSFASPSMGSAGSAGSAEAPGAVFFYAAQTTELTPEMRLPSGEPQAEKQGLFGFALRRALDRHGSLGRPMTYRQLGQIVLTQYAGMNLISPTPMFGGNALDRFVFGQQTLAVRQWPISRERMTVPIGTLSGLAEGARFAVVPHAAADAGPALGSLRAVRVGLNHAELEPLAWDGKPAPDVALLPAGAHARLTSSPERYSLRVAMDARACREGCRWRAALEALRSQGVPGADLQWVDNTDGDLNLHVGAHELVGLPADRANVADCGARGRPCDERGRGTLLLSSADGDDPQQLARRLAQRLHAVARALNLARLAARTAVPDAPGVEATVAIQPQGAGASARRAATPAVVTRAQVGDQLVVTLNNRGKKPSDVTLLYLDVRHGLNVLFPLREGDVNRLEPGASLHIDDIALSDNDGAFGVERLVVIAVEAERLTQRADFSFLAQSPLETARIRGIPMDDEAGAFIDAAFSNLRSRSTPPREPGRRTRMQMFGIDLAPPAAKETRAR